MGKDTDLFMSPVPASSGWKQGEHQLQLGRGWLFPQLFHPLQVRNARSLPHPGIPQTGGS